MQDTHSTSLLATWLEGKEGGRGRGNSLHILHRGTCSLCADGSVVPLSTPPTLPASEALSLAVGIFFKMRFFVLFACFFLSS